MITYEEIYLLVQKTIASATSKQGKRIIFNWKSEVGIIEGIKILNELPEVVNPERVVILPPITALSAVIPTISKRGFSYGSQRICSDKHIQMSGVVAPKLLVELGCTYALISEGGCAKHGEKEKSHTGSRVAAALNSGICPIICVGETEKEHDLGIGWEKVGIQIKEAVLSVEPKQLKKIAIVYQPFWYIDNGIEKIIKTLNKIRSTVQRKCGESIWIFCDISSMKSDKEIFRISPFVDGLYTNGSDIDKKLLPYI